MDINEALARYALRKTIGDALADEAALDGADIKDALMDEVEAGSAADTWSGRVDGAKVATAYVRESGGREARTEPHLVVRDPETFNRWLVTRGTGLAQEFAARYADQFLAYATSRLEGEAIPGVGVEQVTTAAVPPSRTIAIRVNRKKVRELVAAHMDELPPSVAGLLGVGNDA